MRVCELHREKAIETLKSLKDGTEYDLCPQCAEIIKEIMRGKPENEVKRGRKRAT